ncbi:hypothetical protein [Jiangella sp. DSM 45060]|uniref:hypothetical protein n=1 Tax=Jiangella sp. DSM 45060 TaxID=1798224 RepID=UPI00087CF143|nr:hypothetical protein [Jiangella sp. DSM 45060]SDT14232.1 hypothetical protein SAMN04515669_2902 [Jiangella sp. DSM 45060]
MTNEPPRPVRDEHYNLITVLQASLEFAWQMETYISDAEQAGDGELAEWFRKIRDNDLKAGEQGKRLLAARLAPAAGA